MRYRVKTRQLRSFSIGDTVEKRKNSYWLVTDNPNHCISLPEAIVENTRWFEPIKEVEAGQYWKWDYGIAKPFRINNIDEGTVWYNHIDGDEEQFVGRDYLRANATLLSDDEVEQALIEEAKNRFEGSKVKNMDNSVAHEWEMGIGVTWQYAPEKDELWLSGCVKMYGRGKWAEIIEDEWEVRSNTRNHFLTKKDRLISGVNGGMNKKEAEAIAEKLNDLEG